MLTQLFQKSQLFVKNNNLEYQRYFIKKEKLEHRLSIILGARGIGKTTTIAQYMSRYPQDKALYISLVSTPAPYGHRAGAYVDSAPESMWTPCRSVCGHLSL